MQNTASWSELVEFQIFVATRNFYDLDFQIWNLVEKCAFSLKSGDFGVLLVEISEVLPVEISIIFFSSISAFTGKKYYVHTTHGALFFEFLSPPQ